MTQEKYEKIINYLKDQGYGDHAYYLKNGFPTINGKIADILANQREHLATTIKEHKELNEVIKFFNGGNDIKQKDTHYNNENGSLYKIAVERGWNAYQFDAIKRIDRAYKKGQFEEDIRKTIKVLKMMDKGE